MPEEKKVPTAEELQKMSIAELAYLIAKDWKNVWFGAKPYLDAMSYLENIKDYYIFDTGESVVLYFLSNATTWRGETARAVKKELNRRLKTVR